MKRGIYLTVYGNAAYVSGPNAKTAKDLDMGERIPITMVDPNSYQGPADSSGRAL